MNKSVFQKSADASDGAEVPHRGVLRPRDFADDFTFAHYPPPEHMAQYIAYIWVISWNFPPGVRRTSPAVLPDPQVNIYFASDGAGIQGVFRASRTYEATGHGKVAGITFKPAGLYAFWPQDMSTLTDTNVSLTGIFPGVDDAFVVDLLAGEPDEIASRLGMLLDTCTPVHDVHIGQAQQIVVAIEHDTSLVTVEDVARQFATSERTLQALFQRYVGVGVKWMLLRKRLLAAAERMRAQEEPDWAAVALDLGYSSQAHFNADFKRTTGMNPTTYLRFVS